MEPELVQDGLVMASGIFGRLKPGNIVIVRHAGLEKIKRIQTLDTEGLFLVGDNLNGSTDSRHFGKLGYDAVVAKVIWPR